MQTAEENTIALHPVMEELSRLAAWIESFAETHGCSPADSMALALAAEELFTNTVRHSGSSATQASVSVRLERLGDRFRMVYSDAGAPFDTAAAAQTAPSAQGNDVSSMTPGGLGLHFLSRTMQAVYYERVNGRNITTVERHRGNSGLAR